MAQLPLPPNPNTGDSLFNRWLILLRKRVDSAGQILWSALDFSGSNLTDLETRNHNDLQNIQGGATGDHQHLTTGQLQKALNPPVFFSDPEEGVELLPPWEGIRSTDAFIGIQTENGVTDRAHSTLSFDDATRTFTITPVGSGFEVFSYGKRIYVTSPQSVTISDVEGGWAVYWDAFGVLSVQLGFTDDLILTKAFCALIYWDADNDKNLLIADERHGRVMDSQTHLYLHNTRKAVYGSGLALTNFIADGSGDLATHAQFACSGGVIWDEDIKLTITAGLPQTLSPIAQIPCFYRLGASGLWRLIPATDFPLSYGSPGPGTRANYNQLTGGAWQLTEVPNNDFVLMHYFATNDILTRQIIGIVGQAEYATLAAAQAAAETEIANLVTTGLPSVEFVAIATVIFQTANTYGNTPKSRIRKTDGGADYVDWRSSSTVALGGGSIVVTTVPAWVFSFAAAHG